MSGVSAFRAVLALPLVLPMLGLAETRDGFTSDFPGGNGHLVSLDVSNRCVTVASEPKGGSHYFWFNFKMDGLTAGVWRFRGVRLTAVGPAVSEDGGRSWRFLSPDGKAKTDSFAYAFGASRRGPVQFALSIPYQLADWQRLMDELPSVPGARRDALCRDRSGREVPMFVLEPTSGVARVNFLFTARHHCCEVSASHVLEGVVRAACGDSDEARWLRAYARMIAVPFMDLDGAEAGDQGKNRPPHDHNRDYVQGLYPTVRAVRNLICERYRDVPFHSVDLHAPDTRGNEHDHVYALGPQGEPMNARWQVFRRTFAELTRTASLRYDPRWDIPYGKPWNDARHFATEQQGLMASRRFFWRQKHCWQALSIECGYGLCGGVFSKDGARELGANLFRATLRTYREEQNVRYLAANGNDAADGRTPETAWRTLEKLNADLPAGATARLRCGDVFYGRAVLKPGPDPAHPTTLTSWGEGARPEICTYRTVRGSPSLWQPAGTNRWTIDLGDVSLFTGNRMTDSGNLGFLKVDGRICGNRLFSRERLASDWDFFCDGRTTTVYCVKNPALAAREIRVAVNGGIVPLKDNTVVRGLTLRGTGSHGMSGIARNVLIEDCDLHEIGGSVLTGHGDGRSRFGNGIECWAGSSDVRVRRVEISDVYDVAFTMQGGNPPRSWANISMTDSRVERCSQAFEIWAQWCRPGIGFRACAFLRNRVVDTARGWGYDVRRDKSNATPLLAYNLQTDLCDILVASNVFENTRGLLVYKAGGISLLPETYRIVDNTIVGPTGRSLAYAVGDPKRAEAERARERKLREENRILPSGHLPPYHAR